MLDFENGQKNLAALRFVDPHIDAFVPAMDQLPAKLKSLANLLLNACLEGEDFPNDVFVLNEKQLLQIFKVFFGDTSSAALATWYSIGQGPYLPFQESTLFRSPKHPHLARVNQEQWLRQMLDMFLNYPSDVTCPEGLSVWAPYFDHRLMGQKKRLLNPDSDLPSAHIGRYLAKVIDLQDTIGQKVLANLRLAITDSHPTSLFGLHAIYALWRSSHVEANNLIFDKLTRTEDSLIRFLIIRGALEADLPLLQRVLQLISGSEWLDEDTLYRELLSWFGLSKDDGERVTLKQYLALALASWHRTEPTHPDAPFEEKLFYVWSLMTREVDDGTPLLEDLLRESSTEHRLEVLRFAELTKHPKLMQILRLCMDDHDLSVVLGAFAAITNFLIDEIVSGSPELLDKVAAVCRRAYSQKESFPRYFDKARSFFESLESLLFHLWTNQANQSLDMFGPAAQDRSFHLDRFVSNTYVAPDDFSIEARLKHVEYRLDSSATSLWASSLKPHHWAELLQKKERNSEASAPKYIEVLTAAGNSVFAQTLKILLHHRKSSVRTTGLGLLDAAVQSPLAAAAAQLAKQLPEPIGAVSENEARLRLRVGKLYCTEQYAQEAEAVDLPPGDSSQSLPETNSRSNTTHANSVIATGVPPECQPSPEAEAIYPGTTITPKERKPVYKRIERSTDTCRQLLDSLYQFIANDIEKMVSQEPAEIRNEKWQSLQNSNDSQWPTAYKQAFLNWWEEVGEKLAQPQDLARLASRWFPTDGLEGLNLPEGLDLSQLDALRIAPEITEQFELFLREKLSVDSEEVLSPYRLKISMLIDKVLCFLLKVKGSWQDAEYYLDMADSIMAAIPSELMTCIKEATSKDLYQYRFLFKLHDTWLTCQNRHLMTVDLLQRWYQYQNRQWRVCMEMYAAGAATLGDVVQGLVDLFKESSITGEVFKYEEIVILRRCPRLAQEFNHFFDHVTKTIIESELIRPAKDLTQWSPLANRIGYLEGYVSFERLLLATAKNGFTRPTDKLTNQAGQWAILAGSIYPEPRLDSVAVIERLKSLLDSKQIDRSHLLRAAILAPQWSEVIADVLNWPKLAKLIYWLDSHVTDHGASFRPDVRLAMWLSADNREERTKTEQLAQTSAGFLYDWHKHWQNINQDKVERSEYYSDKIYIDWFYSIAEYADDTQWKLLLEALDVVLTPSNLKKLQTIVESLRGTIDRQSLLDSVSLASKPVDARPLALLPLSGGRERGMDLLERHRALIDYRKRCQRMSSPEYDLENVDYALGILAYRAGLANQEELEWTIQVAAAQQFEEFRLVTSGDIEVQLIIETNGMPSNRITQAGKPLKTIPAAIKNYEPLEEQQRLLKSLKKFATDSQKMLQRSLAQSRTFTLDQFKDMQAHPILQRMLATLLITDGKQVGLLSQDCSTLTTRENQAVEVSKGAQLRLAHPVDLIELGGWIAWREWLRTWKIEQCIPQVERGLFLPAYFTHNRNGAVGGRKDSLPWFSHYLNESKFSAVLRGLGWTMDEDNYRSIHSRRGGSGLVEVEFDLQVDLMWFMVAQNSSYQIRPIQEFNAIDFSESCHDVYAAVRAAALSPDSTEAEISKEAITAFLDKVSPSNTHWVDSTLVINGFIGTYFLDPFHKDIRMDSHQFIPFHTFAETRDAAMTEAITQLSDEQSERAVMLRLKFLSE